MSNLKRRFIEVALVVVILLTLTSGRVFGEEVHPLRDLMLTPTNSVYAEYGYSEDTFRFFNFVKLKEACQIFEAQIKALRAEVDELKKLVAGLVERNALQSKRATVRLKEIDELLSDPNDVGEGKE